MNNNPNENIEEKKDVAVTSDDTEVLSVEEHNAVVPAPVTPAPATPVATTVETLTPTVTASAAPVAETVVPTVSPVAETVVPTVSPVAETVAPTTSPVASVAPATAEEIVKQAEAEANKAAADYSKKEAPVAPQQDRVQLIDTKPKLHAVQFGGVTMSTEKKEVSENTEVLETVTEPEKVDDAATNNTGPSKLRVTGLVCLFVGLLALVIFLPDISSYIQTKKYLHNQENVEEITTGILECTMDDSSDNLDYSYTFTFNFKDKKMYRLKSMVEIRGDASLDETELDKLKSECDLLNVMVKDLKGIEVSCKLANGLFTKNQTFNFSSIVVDDAITAYIEAGGQYPSYRSDDNIDEIEKDLLSSNYNCQRMK